jgi:hypothetical protein
MYYRQNLAESAPYLASIFGRSLAKMWVIVGIPAFILSVVMTRYGYEYWPAWINEIGIQSQLQFIVVILSFYITAYTIGRLIGSPQRTFNKARMIYERVVTSEGYWFDNRNTPQCYARYQDSLNGAKQIYHRLSRVLGKTDDDMTRQRMMTLHYQQALLLSTLRIYDEADRAIKKCRNYKSVLAGSRIWEPHEESVFESQLLFLEAELAFVRGNKQRARDNFNKSKEIDRSLNDHEGVTKNDERLKLISSA